MHSVQCLEREKLSPSLSRSIQHLQTASETPLFVKQKRISQLVASN